MLKKLVLFATLLVIAAARPQAHVSMASFCARSFFFSYVRFSAQVALLPINLKQTKNVVANMNEDSFDEQNVMADSSDTAAEVIEGGKRPYIAALCLQSARYYIIN